MLRATGSLGLASTQRLLDTLYGDERVPKRVEVDLRAVTFAEPFALVALACHLERVSEAGADVELVCPDDFGCRRYLAASNVIQHVAEFGTVRGDQGLRRVGASGRDTVLPLTRLSNEAEIEQVLDEIDARLGHVIGAGDLEVDRVKGPVQATVLEMCANVFQHADYPVAWIAAQRYSPRQPYVELAIGDAGRGVRGSLSTRYPALTTADDVSAIREALGGLSRLAGETRGNGYFVLKDATRELDGSFLLRSGSGEVGQGRGRSSLQERAGDTRWPGTIVRARMRAGR